MKPGCSLSIIVEWSNALLTEADRPARMMEALLAQASELESTVTGCAGDKLFPLEVLICYDGNQVSSERISAMAPLAAPGSHGPLRVSHCNFPGAEYYDLKNLGAERAGGELFLFLDSDVVPQDSWLENLWSAFDDPGHVVMAGVSFIEPVSLYAKATALNWVFSLPPAWQDIRPGTHFWANNACFRRDAFKAYPFPAMNGASRGACRELADTLVTNGVPLHVNGAARVTHPAPAGLTGYFQRAMAQGRDRVLWHQRFSSWWMQSAPAGFLRYIKHLGLVAWSTLTRYRQVGVRAWEVPVILLISSGYYTVFLLAELATHIAPGLMKKSFRV